MEAIETLPKYGFDPASLITSKETKPEKLIIAIDIDSVLADTIIEWCNVYNDRYKDQIQKRTMPYMDKTKMIGWDIHKYVPITENEVYDIFAETWVENWDRIPPTEPYIADVIKEMKDAGHYISILSARKRNSYPAVMNWLNELKIPFDEITLIQSHGRCKCSFPFDILIDDSYDNVIKVEAPKKAILFTQPWNREFDYPERVNSLGEFVDKYL